MRTQRKQPDPLALPPEQRDAICILGGRSGTSFVARLVNLLGVSLGPEEHMVTANLANQAGFWEHREIVALNDEILARHCTRWPKLVPLPAAWEKSPKLDDLRERALQLIRAEFAGASMWGWKDPRSCVTLPFWQALVPRMRYVLCFRNPVDTASSNAETLTHMADGAAWDGLAQAQKWLYLAGLTNWIEFVRCMIQQTSGRPRMAVFFEDAMEDTEGELRRIARFIGKPGAAMDPNVRRAVGEFKNDKLRRHKRSLEEVLAEPALPMAAKSAFLSLRAHVDREREGAAGTDSLLAELEENGDERRVLREHVHRVIAGHTAADAQIAIGSHGDDELLSGAGRVLRHFPQDARGEYLGRHPADSADAILGLREAQARGAAFLAIPQRQLWWLDHYIGLREHLDSRHRSVYCDGRCVLYELLVASA